MIPDSVVPAPDIIVPVDAADAGLGGGSSTAASVTVPTVGPVPGKRRPLLLRKPVTTTLVVKVEPQADIKETESDMAHDQIQGDVADPVKSDEAEDNLDNGTIQIQIKAAPVKTIPKRSSVLAGAKARLQAKVKEVLAAAPDREGLKTDPSAFRFTMPQRLTAKTKNEENLPV